MSIEVSDEQFERLVGMLAEIRVDLRQGLSDVYSKLEDLKRDTRVRSEVLRAGLQAVEEDLSRVQATQRRGMEIIGKIDQSVDGLTQATKTALNMAETAMRHAESANNFVGLSSAKNHHGEPSGEGSR